MISRQCGYPVCLFFQIALTAGGAQAASPRASPVPRGAGVTGRPEPVSVPWGTVGPAALNVSAGVGLSVKRVSVTSQLMA